MPHRCSAFWGAPATKLTRLLNRTTAREHRAWNRARPKDEAFEGWIHRADKVKHYRVLMDLYLDLLLALKQPTDIPNDWRRSKVAVQLAPVPSKGFADLARAVRRGLRVDGGDLNARKVPVHSKNGIPRYGTANWLEQPNKGRTAADLRKARALLLALRHAFGR